ncbi:unnamed protein product [Darwinula stevensoni]|uniref:Uncharacterized protein n=1 Tax=Darwinula stevensoni TaxID=69355 RepID=A0A7R9FP99_9CRUS|nr:unnamed protein product [Darwinula stevensoni]CAG0897337.1 unnamed protein product [Darwinula stevensoni]
MKADYCSQQKEIPVFYDYRGNLCTGTCEKGGYSYNWCYSRMALDILVDEGWMRDACSVSATWGYCSPSNDVDRYGEECKEECQSKDSKEYTCLNKRGVNEWCGTNDLDIDDCDHPHGLSKRQAGGGDLNQPNCERQLPDGNHVSRVRLDYQGLVNNNRFVNLQLQLNGVYRRSQEDSTTVAQVHIPLGTYIPTRFIRHALLLSYRYRVVIQLEIQRRS